MNPSWSNSLKYIPGGNGLISKRPSRYCDDWPTFFSKAKGIDVYDLDGKRYIDAAQMGMGSSILGYAFSPIDEEVVKHINLGINTTLNCPEEFLLAKKLSELHPFDCSVKFARSGGEAMAIAIRIARSFSDKDVVAFSGYHGWHDWYLSANLSGDELKYHLLSGVRPSGVPKGLKKSSIPFEYNNIDDFKRVVSENEIGVVVIEGCRYEYPQIDFIKTLEQICFEKNIVLIVDEITSGWRITDGGVFKKFDMSPDIIVYGKGMGNGYAISAIAGKKDVMSYSEASFVSSTFWTERVGFVAGLNVIDFILKNKVYDQLNHIGSLIGLGWKELSKKHGLNIQVTEVKPLISFKYIGPIKDFNSKFTSLMLERGYLAASSIYVSYSHDEFFVENYLKNVDEVFHLIK